MSQEQDDAIVGREMRERIEAKTKLTRLQAEAVELGEKFEALGKQLKGFPKAFTGEPIPHDPQKAALQKFESSLNSDDLDSIESYKQHLSKDTYESITKWKAEIPDTAKALAGLNEKLKPFDVHTDSKIITVSVESATPSKKQPTPNTK